MNKQTITTSEKAAVFLGGLHPLTTEKEIRESISCYSQIFRFIQKSGQKQNQAQTRCKDYVIIEISSNASEKLLKQGTIRIRGRKVKVTSYLVGDKLSKYLNQLNLRRLLLNNIPQSMKPYKLRKYFSKFGEIENCYKIRKYGRKKETDKGFLVFTLSSSAEKVLEIEQHFVSGSTITCQLKRRNQQKYKKSQKGTRPNKPNHTNDFRSKQRNKQNFNPITLNQRSNLQPKIKVIVPKQQIQQNSFNLKTKSKIEGQDKSMWKSLPPTKIKYWKGREKHLLKLEHSLYQIRFNLFN